jgi:aminoglycoside phosphotransferase (APT) family kinase protein
MNRVLASIHKVNIEGIGLGDYGRPGNYFKRQIDRWSKQYKASETHSIRDMDALIQWLPKNMPPDDGQISLVHGDFRLDNMMFHPSQSRVLAVVDWELSTLGHPYADLAYQCMQLRMQHTGVMSGLGGIHREPLGIPTEQDYVAEYCQRMQIDHIPHWSFYLAFSFFRFAAILQGVKKRALEGNASSQKALQMGELVIPLAANALELT